MRVIVLHSPKGGVGRTMTCIALARALQRRGLRVHVVDASDHYNDGTAPLTGWSERTGKHDPDCVHSIQVTVASDAGPMLDILAPKSRRESTEDCDVLLVDTAKNLDDRSRIALQVADLVLTPFQTHYEAEGIAEILSRSIPRTTPLRGLFFGFDDEFPDARNAARRMMADYPLLENEMPFDRDMFSALLAGETPVSPAGFPDNDAKWKGWPLVEALACTIMNLQATRTG